MPYTHNTSIVVYKASAGSGKTFTLVVNYLTLVLSQSTNPNDFRHVLAVTFTNKATTEMKERIISQLYGLSHGLPGSNDYLHAVQQQCRLNEAEIRERAGNVLSALIHNYNFFAVGTIDAFFKQVVTTIALELNLQSGFQVDIDDKTVINNAVDRIFDRLKPGTRVLNRILQFMDDRLLNDEKWDMRKELKKFAMENLFKGKYMTASDNLSSFLADEKKIQSFISKLNALRSEAIAAFKSMAAQWKQALRDLHLEESDFSNGKDAFRNYFQTLAAGMPPEPKKRFLDKYESADAWVAKSNKRKAELQSAVDTRLFGLLTQIETRRREQETLYNNTSLTLKNMNSLGLITTIDDTVKEINHEQGRYMLARIPLLINKLIEDSDAPFVLEKAGTRFGHILIDEFQDTSVIEWKNFRTLLVNNLAEGGLCLLVGDVKQSIYRWRGSDWRNLHTISAQFDGRCSIKNLDTNYRSDFRIVDFNNFFFNSAIKNLGTAAGSMEQTIKDIYQDVKQQCRASEGNGHVSVRLYRKAKKTTAKDAQQGNQEKNDVTGRLLNELKERIESMHKAGLPYREMIILFRSKNEMEKVISYFGEHCSNIPLISDEAFALGSSLSVKMIIGTLQYLSDTENHIAKAFITYHYFNDIRKEPTTWFEAAQKKQDALFNGWLKEREELLKMPFFELIEKIIFALELNLLPGQDAFIHAFLDEVSAYLNDRVPTLDSFLSYWEETLCAKKIPSSAQNGIRLLTIHKSKGLEAHTVFIPFCNWDLYKDEGDIWCAPTQAPYNELSMAPITLSKRMKNSIYSAYYEEEHAQQLIENINLLYVAFTRARKNLFVQGICNFDKNETKTAADVVLSVIAPLSQSEDDDLILYENGDICAETKQKAQLSDNPLEAIENPMPQPLEIFNSHMKFRQSNESYEFTHGENSDDDETQQNEYIRTGNLLHKLFESIRTHNDIERVVANYERQGIFTPQVTAAHLRALLNSNMQVPQIADWLSGDWEVHNECNILYRDESGSMQVRRPDRVLTKNGRTIVIDLKFGNEKPSYHQQVREYVSLLQNMGHSHVEGYLWFVYTHSIVKV